MLSIIVAVKNDAVMLEQLLCDIETQTYRDYEVIVADGGSSDDSVAVAKRHGALVITSQEGDERDMIGSASDKNRASQVASGEWLLHIDSDMRFNDSEQLERSMMSLEFGEYVAGSMKIKGYNGGIREIFRRNIDPVLTQAIFVKKDVFLDLGGFPLCHLWDWGLHNRFLVAGYKPVLLDEEIEHLREYRDPLPHDWDFLPWRVNNELVF